MKVVRLLVSLAPTTQVMGILSNVEMEPTVNLVENVARVLAITVCYNLYLVTSTKHKKASI